MAITSGNLFGTISKLDSLAVDAPSAKTYHGLTINLESGATIGRIRSWNPNVMNREGTHLYELNVQSYGRPVDYVPGIATGFTVAMTRAELWQVEIEVATGLTTFDEVWADLIDQTRPFRLNETIYRGNSMYRQWQYLGCWFRSRNEAAADAQGDGIYVVDAEIAFVQRVRLL